MDFSTLELSRFQFATTSIFHFFFVPFTVGFALFIALLQSIAFVRRSDDLERLTRFFGHLFSSISWWASSPASCRSFSSA